MIFYGSLEALFSIDLIVEIVIPITVNMKTENIEDMTVM